MIKIFLGYVALYVSSAVIVVGFVPLLITKDGSFWVMKAWSKTLLWIAKFFWGIEVEIKNQQALPDSGSIIACKHQSTLEIIALGAIVKRPVFFLKSSLLYIPFLNLYLLRTGQLAVRRWVKNNGTLFGRAVEQLKTCNIIIFPEGGRVGLYEERPFKPGVAVLAKQAKAPVIPVSTNAGIFWPRRQIAKTPGKAILNVMGVMQVENLKEDLHKLQKIINDDSKKLIDENDTCF